MFKVVLGINVVFKKEGYSVDDMNMEDVLEVLVKMKKVKKERKLFKVNIEVMSDEEEDD